MHTDENLEFKMLLLNVRHQTELCFMRGMIFIMLLRLALYVLNDYLSKPRFQKILIRVEKIIMFL